MKNQAQRFGPRDQKARRHTRMTSTWHGNQQEHMEMVSTEIKVKAGPSQREASQALGPLGQKNGGHVDEGGRYRVCVVRVW